MRTPARLLALAVLASVTTLAPTTSSAATTSAIASEAAPRATTSVSRYNGTFQGNLTWRHRVEFGGINHHTARADIKVTSTLVGVRFAANGTVLPATGKGRVVATGVGESRTVTDEGAHTGSCAGVTVNPTTGVSPFLVPVGGRPTFYAFTSLSLVESCSSTSKPEPYANTMVFPAVPAPVSIPRSTIGAARITIPVNQSLPAAKCPGREPRTTTCSYNLRGTLTLRLVPDIDVFTAPTRPTLRPGATKASIVARCAQTCRATLTVRPLRGSGRIAMTSRLRPGVRKTLAVKPKAALRTSIKRSGGARLTVTYRIGNRTKSYTRTVRTR